MSNLLSVWLAHIRNATTPGRITAPSREQLAYLIVSAVSTLAVLAANRPRLWIDEQITRELIHRWTVWEILTVLPLWQPHYPTYYLLPEIAGWQATRFVSLISLPVTVYATAQAARALADYQPRDAYLAGVLAAASPYLAVQASWMRMYAPVTALLSVGVWLGLQHRYRGSAVAMLAGSLLHVFGYFGVVWLAIVAYADRDRRTAIAAGLLGSLPPLAFVIVNTGLQSGVTKQTTGMGHGITPSLLHVLLTPVAALAGSPHSALQVAGVLVVSVLVVQARADWRVLAWLLLPLAGISLGSYLVHPVFRLKYFGLLAPAVALLVANPRQGRWRRRLVLALVAGLFVLGWAQRAMPTIVTRRFIFWF